MAVLFLAVAVGCGIWASSLAEKRGRSKGAHFFLGFLFGPLGVLIAALRGPDYIALGQQPPKPMKRLY